MTVGLLVGRNWLRLLPGGSGGLAALLQMRNVHRMTEWKGCSSTNPEKTLMVHKSRGVMCYLLHMLFVK